MAYSEPARCSEIPTAGSARWSGCASSRPERDRYGGDVTVTGEGTWHFRVESWSDPIAAWQHDAGIKIPRGQDVELMLTEGALLFERAARSIRQPPGATRPAAARTALNALARRLRDRSMPPWDRLAAAAAPPIAARARPSTRCATW